MMLDYYYWGKMCPITHDNITLMNAYQDRITISLHDVTRNALLAKEQQMFFPFLTVINKEKRYYEPITKTFLDNIVQQEMPVEEPYLITLGKIEKVGNIIPITKDTYEIASTCTGRANCKGCEEKIHMYQNKAIDVFGYMNIDGNHLLGGVEYYPSLLVPYDIEKREDIAFLTCVYTSDEIYDYKSTPLQSMERYLSLNYKKVSVISDEISTFPNGTLAYFKSQGYQDDGVVFEDTYCRLHQVSKQLL